jgi:hypothetical protein
MIASRRLSDSLGQYQAIADGAEFRDIRSRSASQFKFRSCAARNDACCRILHVSKSLAILNSVRLRILFIAESVSLHNSLRCRILLVPELYAFSNRGSCSGRTGVCAECAITWQQLLLPGPLTPDPLTEEHWKTAFPGSLGELIRKIPDVLAVLTIRRLADDYGAAKARREAKCLRDRQDR